MFLPVRKRVLGILLCICAVMGFAIGASVTLLSEVKPQKMKFNVSGLMAAALTSINDDYTVNLTGIPDYVDYLVKNGVKSVLVGGSSGEHMFLSVEDRKRIIAAWVDAAAGQDMHVQVQVGGAPFADVLDLANFSASCGVDSILTLPDLYHKPSSTEELVSYVEMVAKTVPYLPVFYYHIPKKTQVNIKMPDFVAIASAQIPNFMGIKFTSYDLVEASQVLQLLVHPQKLFLGGEHLLAPAAVIGIDSYASPAVNLFPALMRSILGAVDNGSLVQARDWQRKLSSYVYDISKEGGRIPAMKVGMALLSGIKMGPPALPAKPVSRNMRTRIEDYTQIFRNLDLGHLKDHELITI